MAMTPRQIQKALREKGVTMEDVGQRLTPSVTRTTVWKNVHKVRGGTSARVQDAIAEILEKPKAEVFGDGA